MRRGNEAGNEAGGVEPGDEDGNEAGGVEPGDEAGGVEPGNEATLFRLHWHTPKYYLPLQVLHGLVGTLREHLLQDLHVHGQLLLHFLGLHREVGAATSKPATTACIAIREPFTASGKVCVNSTSIV